jgi:CMP/dCMP kinase
LKPSIIAIDGPSASGKSTIGQLLAQQLDYVFFDTGVMYRAVTWEALQRAVPIENEDEITLLAEQIVIDVLLPNVQDGRLCTVLIDGKDVTWDIRRREVEKAVSPASAYRGVRTALSAQQRRIGLGGRIVMVGRDIGTVVLPEADLKLYLDASPEERARRRYLEKTARGDDVTYADVLEDMKRRDQIDSSRAIAPLRPAEDAVVVDTDGLNIEEVLAYVDRLVGSNCVSMLR